MFHPPRHDHRACMRDALRHAESVCADNGARLTRNRRRVLELLLADHRPLGAYDMVERIDWDGRRPAVAQVYRALDFLRAQGLIHRLETLNAYVACDQRSVRHRAQFLVCEQCGRVAEADDARLRRQLEALARRAGFALRVPVIELRGLCPECVSDGIDDGR